MNTEQRNRILQVFRKKSDLFFSIENVFLALQQYFRRTDITIIRAEKQGVRFSNYFQFRKFRDKYNLFHITGDIHYIVFAYPARKVILTIHDCVFLKNYSGVKKWLLKKILLEWPVKYARTITTISDKTKAEILVYSGCDPKKIHVIPNPVSSIFSFTPGNFNSDTPRILFLGKTPNKNLDRVIEALTGIPCVLHIIGLPTSAQYSALESSQINFIIESGLAPEEIANRYALCDIVLFPSWYEGFGLPIIEAFSTGRVVVTSNISPMREVADGGAYLVDPYDVESIRNGVIAVSSDQALRHKLIERGRIVVERYKPERIAKMYEDLYLELAN